MMEILFSLKEIRNRINKKSLIMDNLFKVGDKVICIKEELNSNYIVGKE